MASGVKTPVEVKERILEYARSGMKNSEIAKRTGVSTVTVNRIRKQIPREKIGSTIMPESWCIEWDRVTRKLRELKGR